MESLARRETATPVVRFVELADEETREVVRGQILHELDHPLADAVTITTTENGERHLETVAIDDREPAGLAAVLHRDEAGVDEARHDVAVAEHQVYAAAGEMAEVQQAVLAPHEGGEHGVADRVQEDPTTLDEGRRHRGVAVEHLAELTLGEGAAEEGFEGDGDVEETGDEERHLHSG